MGKPKNAALGQAPIVVLRQAAIDPTDSVPPKQIAARHKPSPAPEHRAPPTRFAYALKSYTIERRASGWYICRTPFGAGDKPAWTGPFETIETGILAIGRRLATEVADRHTRSIEAHRIKPSDPLYGLKPTTRLRQKKSTTTC